MISLILTFLSSGEVTPVITVAVVLEIIYILIRFLLIVFPKDHKFSRILTRIFKGLQEIEDDLMGLPGSEGKKKDAEEEE